MDKIRIWRHPADGWTESEAGSKFLVVSLTVEDNEPIQSLTMRSVQIAGYRSETRELNRLAYLVSSLEDSEGTSQWPAFGVRGGGWGRSLQDRPRDGRRHVR